jgi:hypothetical protein
MTWSLWASKTAEDAGAAMLFGGWSLRPYGDRKRRSRERRCVKPGIP